MNVGIVGLGLIGGSLAKSTKTRTAHTVWGIDLSQESMMLARMCGAIDATLTEENLPQCDLILIAIRPQAAINWVRDHADLISPSAIVVDMCGVKRIVVEAIAPIAKEHGFAYIGGHPMAGKERGGYGNASADLFDGASMVFTPYPFTPPEAVERLKTIFSKIGFARFALAGPARHDEMIAYTSQLAHVVSSAYVQDPLSREHLGFSAGSYQDMTRVATVDPGMWTDLFLSNAPSLDAALGRLIGRLQKYRDAIGSGDASSLRQYLEEGRIAKEAEKFGIICNRKEGKGNA